MTAQHYHVFVSYSRKDEQIVTPIVQLMRVVGASTFQDRDSIEPGRPWRDIVFTAIEEAYLVIVFWSQHSSKSEEVRKEWTRGFESGKKVVPIDQRP